MEAKMEMTRMEALTRLAEICRDEVCDEWTDYEDVVLNHKRLAGLALGIGEQGKTKEN